VRLLFDHNLSPRLVTVLADIFPESDHVFRLGLDQAQDRSVWEFAVLEGFMIVTKDADFSDLSMMLGFPPKVIWIRRGNCRTVDIEIMLRHHHADILALNGNEIMGLLTLF
jgi:predicted nuclease of predicted toxin-antitoxin system